MNNCFTRSLLTMPWGPAGTDKTASEQALLDAVIEELERLRARHPGWRIWYVPQMGKGATWCAQPLPILNSPSAEELETEMATAEKALRKPV